MPKHQFESELRGRAREFIDKLRASGIEAQVIEGSLREYSIKIGASSEGKDFGAVVVYYSPKSDSFSLKTHELKDKSIAPLLKECWEKRPSAKQAQSTFDIYVDGSFMNGSTGYGAVILKDGKVADELSGAVDASEVDGTRQVAGELFAVIEALNWCREHLINEVSIYFDYLGIEKWATGQWKANQPLTQEYARFVRESPIKIQWHKVDSHTGDRWNDRADVLAKKGAGSIQAAGEETNLVAELLKKTEAWIEYLMIKGIDAVFERVYNEQFARVCILQADQTSAIFDLYNTKKKKFSPYLHGFHDEDLKLRIETLWKEFLASKRVS